MTMIHAPPATQARHQNASSMPNSPSMRLSKKIAVNNRATSPTMKGHFGILGAVDSLIGAECVTQSAQADEQNQARLVTPPTFV